MKRKVVIIALIALATLTSITSIIADSNTSGTALDIQEIKIKDNAPLTASSFCGLVQDWFIREYDKADMIYTYDCFVNTQNELINSIGNTGIFKTIGFLDEFDNNKQITSYELCELLFQISVQLNKYPDNLVGEQISIDGVDKNISSVNFINQVVGLSDNFNGNEVPTNDRAKELIDKFGEWLENTEPGAPETFDVTETDELVLSQDKRVRARRTNQNGLITSAKYKQPSSLSEIAENWESIPVFDIYNRKESKLGFLNIWEGISNIEELNQDYEISDMIITTYPKGSLLSWDMYDSEISLSHPMYMNMGYCDERIDTIPPDTNIFTIKDYTVTSRGDLDWVTSSIYLDKQSYLEADCIGFVVEKIAITNNEEDKDKFTLVVAQIPKFDKSHFTD